MTNLVKREVHEFFVATNVNIAAAQVTYLFTIRLPATLVVVAMSESISQLQHQARAVLVEQYFRLWILFIESYLATLLIGGLYVP